jgi:glycosyltransferase involved in cell wall biosynthesis
MVPVLKREALELAVSVIVPAFNRQQTLSRAFHGLRHQTFRDFEVIVVDDGSAEPLEPWVSRNLREARTVRLASNLGPSAARNAGAEASNGLLLAFLDSDDWWQPEFLKSLVSVFEQPRGVDLCFSDQIWIHPSGKQYYSSALLNKRIANPYLHAIVEPFILGISALVVRKKAFEAIGGFDTDLRQAEDNDLYARLVARGRYFHIPQALVLKFVSEDSLSCDYEGWCENYDKLLDKHLSSDHGHLKAELRLSSRLRIARQAWRMHRKLMINEVGRELRLRSLARRLLRFPVNRMRLLPGASRIR